MSLIRLVELGIEEVVLTGDPRLYGATTTVLTGMRIPNIWGNDNTNGHSLTIDFNNLESKTIKNVKIEECSICLDKQSSIITECNHQFCKDCIDIWSNTNKKTDCPYCRAKLSKDKIFSIKK